MKKKDFSNIRSSLFSTRLICFLTRLYTLEYLLSALDSTARRVIIWRYSRFETLALISLVIFLKRLNIIFNIVKLKWFYKIISSNRSGSRGNPSAHTLFTGYHTNFVLRCIYKFRRRNWKQVLTDIYFRAISK